MSVTVIMSAALEGSGRSAVSARAAPRASLFKFMAGLASGMKARVHYGDYTGRASNIF
jgi:hypothetical protein